MRAAPTVRLALLTLLCGLPALVPGGLWAAGAAGLILLATAAADLLLSHRHIEAMRRVESSLSIGRESRITIECRCLDGAAMVQIKDDLPAGLEHVSPWPAMLATADWQAMHYTVRPRGRGDYSIGPLHLRYCSPMRLWQRQHILCPVQGIRVYPDLVAVRHWEIAIRSGRHLEGLKRARLSGTADFESLREYQPGDQYRAINWTATARSGQLITTLYQVDRSQPIMLLIDAGRLMIPRIEGLTKLDHILNAALLVATVAVERGDQAGLMLFGGEVNLFIPPRKGRGQAMAMLEAVYNAEPEQVEPNYGRMIGWFRSKHKKRSLVLLFTDLVDPETAQEMIDHVAALAKHHLVLLICLTDPEIVRISNMAPSTVMAVYQKAAAIETLSHREQAKARLQRMGVMVIDLPPAQFSTAIVNQYLLIKEQGRL